jgi:hypothetical protein
MTPMNGTKYCGRKDAVAVVFNLDAYGMAARPRNYQNWTPLHDTSNTTCHTADKPWVTYQ